MGYELGVDLGGTTVAAAANTDSHVEMVTLGEHSTTVPAVVFLGDDGALLAGEAAARRAVGQPDRAGRELRRRLGGSTPVRIGGIAHAPAALLGELLREVVDRVAETRGSKPDRVVLPHPAYWSVARRDAFSETIRHAGLPEVRAVTEPEAVAAHYATVLADGDPVAVYDLGGDTFDATVLRRAAGDPEILGLPEGIERLGGNTFDEAILSHVNQVTDGPLAGLDRRDPQDAAAVARLRRLCTLAKETLSVETTTTIPVLLPNRQAEVVLSRAEFEKMIHTTVQTTVVTLLKALQSAQVEPSELAAVLLVGGSARIPLVAQMLTDALARPIVRDAHPKYPVALGAAVLAGDRAGTERPVPGGSGADTAGREGLGVLAAFARDRVPASASTAVRDRSAPPDLPQRARRTEPGGPFSLFEPATPTNSGAPAEEPPAVAATRPATPARRPAPADGDEPGGGESPDAPGVRSAPAVEPTDAERPTSEPSRPADTSAPPADDPRPAPAGSNTAADWVALAARASTGAITTVDPPAATGPAPTSPAPAGATAATAAFPALFDSTPTRPAPSRWAAFEPPVDPFAEPARQPQPWTPAGPPDPPSSPTGGPPASGRPLRRSWLVVAGLALALVLGGTGWLVWDLMPRPAADAPTAAPPAAPDGRPAAASDPTPVVRATLRVGETPGFVAVSPSGRQALVANQAARIITVVDTATNAVTATIPVAAGPPQYLTFSPDGQRVYVSIWDQARTVAAVVVLDTANAEIVATIPVRTRPYLSATTPDGRLLYVPNHDSGTISVIDTGTNAVTTEIKVAPNPHWVEMSNDGTRAYSANHESNLVSVIDTTNNTILAEVPVQTSPHSLAVHPTRPLVANVNYDSASVTMIDTDTDRVVATIPVGKNPQEITWAPDGRHAYVVNTSDDTLTVIDGETATVTATVRTGKSPTAVAVLPDGNTAYVSNVGDGTLSVLRVAG